MHKQPSLKAFFIRLKKLLASKLIYKALTATLIILLIYSIIILVLPYAIRLLSDIQFMNPIYQLVSIEITNKSLVGLFFIALLGSMFFVSYPAEVVFLIYVKYGYNPVLAAIIMIAAIIVSQSLNYLVGYFLGAKLLHSFISNAKKEYTGFLAEHDELFIILFNVFPLPADILTVILGVLKYDFRRAILLSLIGQSMKYLLLTVIILLFNGILSLI